MTSGPRTHELLPEKSTDGSVSVVRPVKFEAWLVASTEAVSRLFKNEPVHNLQPMRVDL